MEKQLARLKNLAPWIFLLLQMARYAGLAAVGICLGAALLVLWQHGFTGKWRLAVLAFFVFSVCFYGQAFHAQRLAKTVRKLIQASA